MAIKTSWTAGEVLTAADLTDTFANKANTASPTFTGTVALPLTTTTGGVDAFSAWGTWTPTYTNLTVGNGTVTAYYKQIGKTIHGIWRLVLGSTSSIGTAPAITLPIQVQSVYANDHPIGTAQYVDTGISGNPGFVVVTGSTTFGLYRINTGTTYTTMGPITATVPFTFGNTDVIHASFTYQGI